MKNRNVSFRAALGVALSLLCATPVLIGCGGSDNNSGNNSSNIVGRWRLTSLSDGNNTTTCTASGGDGGDVFTCSSNDTVDIRADGTATSVSGGETTESRYSLDGNKISATIAGETTPDDSTFSISDGGRRLTITSNDDGSQFVSVFTRL